jgi:hypothetical protein
MNNLIHQDIFLGSKGKIKFEQFNSAYSIRQTVGITIEGNLISTRRATSGVYGGIYDPITYDRIHTFSGSGIANPSSIKFSSQGNYYVPMYQGFGSGNARRKIQRMDMPSGIMTYLYSLLPPRTQPQVSDTKLGKNGEYIFIPGRLHDPFVIMNTSNETFREVYYPSGTSNMLTYWNSSCNGHSNNIYTLIYSGTPGLLEFDYITNSFILHTSPLIAANNEYYCPTLAGNGKIYIPPYVLGKPIIEFDPNTNIFRAIPLNPSITMQTENWLKFFLMRDGKLIAFSKYDRNVLETLIFDPSTDETKVFPQPILDCGFSTVSGVCIGDKIFLSTDDGFVNYGIITAVTTNSKAIIDNTVPPLVGLETSNWNKLFN